MAKLSLSLAIGQYEHTRDLSSGAVGVEGIDLMVSHLSMPKIVHRFMRFQDFDIAEISLGNYCSMRGNLDRPPAIAIPVFPSRVFRHSAIYVRSDSGIEKLDDLGGKRIGIPQWSQTATIFVRGMLSDRGVKLASIKWVQAGVDEAGRPESSTTIKLPDGVDVTPIPQRTLSELILAGEIDAIISAIAPGPFRQGNALLRRLFSDPRKEESELLAKTGIFPIMHTVAIRQDVYEKNRWIARNLVDAFEAAKANAFRRMCDISVSYFPVAWGPEYIMDCNRQLFPGREPWPYGVPPNRATLHAFLRYCWEQGITSRHLVPDELFAPESLQELRE